MSLTDAKYKGMPAISYSYIVCHVQQLSVIVCTDIDALTSSVSYFHKFFLGRTSH